MIEIGIPVYHARATIRDTLDSLVAQTRKRFIICLSLDGDEDDYSDIIKEYQERGLNFRVVTGPNGGPGMARQRILDTTQCEYIIFVDADDMLMPQAIENLYTAIRGKDFDLLRSSFIREEKNKQDLLLKHDIESITWFHGKIYKVDYLKKNNIHFLPGLRVDEDAFFNLVAWNCTEKKGSIDLVTYYWRCNQDSITRKSNTEQYFKDTYVGYIISQIEGLKEIFRIKQSVSNLLISFTLINIYEYYMQAKFYKLPLDEINNLIMSIKDFDWFKAYINKGENWIELVNRLKVGKIIDNKYIIFYEENFATWAKRLFNYGN